MTEYQEKNRESRPDSGNPAHQSSAAADLSAALAAGARQARRQAHQAAEQQPAQSRSPFSSAREEHRQKTVPGKLPRSHGKYSDPDAVSQSRREGPAPLPSRTGRRKKERRKSKALLLSGALAALIFIAAALWFFVLGPAGNYTPPKVILLPLDSRPVNTDLPIQLAAAGGVKVTIPDKELLDQFLTPSQPEPLYQWLKNNTGSGEEVVVLHVNQLLFGGLLNSREEAQYRDASAKLLTLQDYLLQIPARSGQKMVLIYILPRLLPSQYDEEMWAYEKELTELSQLKHRAALDDLSVYPRIYELEQEIPASIRQRYETLYVQAYNTGLSLLDWAEQGYADEVLIGLDDSGEFGLNIKAFNDLKALAGQRGLSQAFFLHGADELGALAIARHSLKLGADSDSFRLVWLTPGQEEVIFPYEAVPLSQNYQEKRNYLYAGKTSAPQHPQPKAKYIYLNSSQELTSQEMAAAWQQIREEERPRGSLAGLADVAKVNGAWQPFMDTVGLDAVYDYVDVYAGWNTAGNSLGTVMAHLVFWEQGQSLSGPAGRSARQAHESLQRIRLLDDYLYQAVVRPGFLQWAEEQGFHYLVFGSRWDEANAQIQQRMDEAASSYRLFKNRQYLYQFPWPRSFELWIREE